MSKKMAMVVLLLLGLAATAAADTQTGASWRQHQLHFITQTDVLDPANRGWLDSTVVTTTGATEASAQRIDTTGAFPLYPSYRNDLLKIETFTDAGTDSLISFVFAFHPTPSTTFGEGGDSLHVKFDVSLDGVNWVLTNDTDYEILDPGTSFQFIRSFTTNLVTPQLPDEDSWFGWPLGRLRIQSDVQGQWEGSVYIQTGEVDPQK